MSQFNINLLQHTQFPIDSLKRANKISGELGSQYTCREGRFLSPNVTTSVEGLGPCIQVLLSSPKRIFNSHIAPETNTVQDVVDTIIKNAVKLRDDAKNKTQELFAFMTGGMKYDPAHPETDISNQMLNELYDALTKEGIETTVIASQVGDATKHRIDTFTRGNKITCQGGPIDNIDIKPNDPIEKIQANLEKYFDFVELSPNANITTTDKLPWSTQHMLDKKI